ncbi:MAG: hypothetical protein HY701_10335 [Gemmatimonadetes bacterium]|nr:hypothetical protein [Gemmatimonadota bacterium]
MAENEGNARGTKTENADALESLKALQTLDREMEAAAEQVKTYEPRIADVEAPAQEVNVEVEAARARIREMRLAERRLEMVSDEKRARLKHLEEKLNLVRNVREEAAVRAEIDIVRRAVETDEQEALELLEQIGRTQQRLAELEAKLAELNAEIEPRRQALLGERQALEQRLAILRDRRANQAIRIDPATREAYERVRSGRSGIAVTALTEDGACGYCFSMIPIQRQAEIRRAGALIHCEACGVILAPPEP